MPLSFAVILGGVVTTIGTSTNLVVSGLLENAGTRRFGLFEISHVGLPMALVGIVRHRRSPRPGCCPSA